MNCVCVQFTIVIHIIQYFFEYNDQLVIISTSKGEVVTGETALSKVTALFNTQNHFVAVWCRSQLLSAGLDGFIVLYDLARLTPKKLVPSIGGAIWCMTRNKSETKIAVGTEDGYVVLYEIQIDGVIFEKSFNKQDSNSLFLIICFKS